MRRLSLLVAVLFLACCGRGPAICMPHAAIGVEAPARTTCTERR